LLGDGLQVVLDRSIGQDQGPRTSPEPPLPAAAPLVYEAG